jgi:predicted ArsR family transcriptional regulator
VSSCRHSKEPFDCHFHRIDERADISPAAKLVYGKLVSLHRTAQTWTQTEIGDSLGLSRHKVWRALTELIGAGLVQSIRVGLGLPNQYVLLGIDPDNLAGKAKGSAHTDGCRPAGHQDAGQSGTQQHHSFKERKKGGRSRDLRPAPPEDPYDYVRGYEHIVHH